MASPLRGWSLWVMSLWPFLPSARSSSARSSRGGLMYARAEAHAGRLMRWDPCMWGGGRPTALLMVEEGRSGSDVEGLRGAGLGHRGVEGVPERQLDVLL